MFEEEDGIAKLEKDLIILEEKEDIDGIKLGDDLRLEEKSERDKSVKNGPVNNEKGKNKIIMNNNLSEYNLMLLVKNI